MAAPKPNGDAGQLAALPTTSDQRHSCCDTGPETQLLRYHSRDAAVPHSSATLTLSCSIWVTRSVAASTFGSSATDAACAGAARAASAWVRERGTEIHFLYKNGKKNVTPAESVSLFHEFKNKYSNFIFISTDGSQKDGKTGAGLTSFDFNKSNRLHDLHSIFTAELQGILSAIHHIIKENIDRGMICSDSSSSLLAIASIQNSAHPLVCKIKNLLRRINSTKQVEFFWIPGHCGIRGNEAADQLAKHSLTLPPSLTNPTILPFYQPS